MHENKSQVISAVLLCSFLLLLFSPLFYDSNNEPAFSGELEPFDGNTFGIQYAGTRANSNQTNILFKFINGSQKQVSVWACRTLTLNKTKDGWVEGPIKGPELITIPAKHASTFEFPAPNRLIPWRCTFNSSRSGSDRISSKSESFFGLPFSKPQPPVVRNILGEKASGVMIGLKPAEEPQQSMLGNLPFVRSHYPNLPSSDHPKSNTAEDIWPEG